MEFKGAMSDLDERSRKSTLTGRVSVLTLLSLKEGCEKRDRKIIFKYFKSSWGGGVGKGHNLLFVAIVNNRI